MSSFEMTMADDPSLALPGRMNAGLGLKARQATGLEHA